MDYEAYKALLRTGFHKRQLALPELRRIGKPHKAKELPKEGEVERHLTGKESEPWELLYFKVYKSQLLVIERALETAGLMLGADKSRGYCLEMICADFLAGANIEEANPEALVSAFVATRYELLPRHRQSRFLYDIAGL